MIALIEQVHGGLTTRRLVVGIGLLVLFWQGYRVFYTLFLSPHRHIPGPWIAKFTRLWELYNVSKGQSHDMAHKLHEQYGPVVRVAPNRFSFNQVEDMKIVYAIGGKFRKTRFYHPNNYGNPSIFSTQDEKEHAARRRAIASMYTMTSIASYEPAVERMVDQLTGHLHRFASDSNQMNMPKLVQLYAFDVITELSANQNLGLMDGRKDNRDILAKAQATTNYMSKLGLFPEFHTTIVRLRKLFRSEDPNIAMRRTIASVIANQRELRKERGGPANTNALTFVDKLLALEEANKATPTMFHDTLGANLAAGTDTTSAALSAAIFYTYRTPTVLQKLREVIKEGESAGTISNPITLDEAHHLPYLQAIVNETLRITPSTSGMLPRFVPEGGAVLAGHFFPAGTEVGINPWAIHRNPRNCGEHPNKFRPERWLDTNLTTDAKNGMSFAFGGGSRTCIGKHIAQLSLNKVLVQIVRNFDLDFSTSGLAPDAPLPATSDFLVRAHYQCVVKEL